MFRGHVGSGIAEKCTDLYLNVYSTASVNQRSKEHRRHFFNWRRCSFIDGRIAPGLLGRQLIKLGRDLVERWRLQDGEAQCLDVTQRQFLNLQGKPSVYGAKTICQQAEQRAQCSTTGFLCTLFESLLVILLRNRRHNATTSPFFLKRLSERIQHFIFGQVWS